MCVFMWLFLFWPGPHHIDCQFVSYLSATKSLWYLSEMKMPSNHVSNSNSPQLCCKWFTCFQNYSLPNKHPHPSVYSWVSWGLKLLRGQMCDCKLGFPLLLAPSYRHHSWRGFWDLFWSVDIKSIANLTCWIICPCLAGNKPASIHNTKQI